MSAFDFIICFTSCFYARHWLYTIFILHWLHCVRISFYDLFSLLLLCKTLAVHYFYVKLCQPFILWFVLFLALLYVQETVWRLNLYCIVSAFEFIICLSDAIWEYNPYTAAVLSMCPLHSAFCTCSKTGCTLFLYYTVPAFDFIICFVSCFCTSKTLAVHYFYITVCQPLIL